MKVKEETEKVGLKLNKKTKNMASCPITSWQIDGETMETVRDFIFLSSKMTVGGDCSQEIKRCFVLGRKAMTNLDSTLKSRDITLVTRVPLIKVMFFPVVTYGCESRTIKKAEHQKNWCFWTVVLEKTLESPLDYKDIKPVNPKGNQCWIFIGKTNAETDAPILWLPNENWLIGKDPDAEKDWKQEEKEVTEDEMIGWHHWLNGHESEQALGAQGSLVCCSPWGGKESDTTEWLNWIELKEWWEWWFSRSVMSYSCDLMDSSPPGSSVHGISQTRIMVWVVISFFRGYSQPKNQTLVSRIGGGFFTDWTTREAPLQEYSF